MTESSEVPVRWRRPASDTFESAGSVQIFADVPGARRQDLTITFDADSLLLETRLPADDATTRVPHYRRRFRVSPRIDRDAIRAQLQDGVLHLTLPKQQSAAQTIEIEE